MSEYLVDRQDWSARYPCGIECRDPLRRSFRSQFLFQRHCQGIAVLRAPTWGGKARVLVQCRRVQSVTQTPPHMLPACRNVDMPILHLERTGRNPGGMIIASLWRPLLAD